MIGIIVNIDIHITRTIHLTHIRKGDKMSKANKVIRTKIIDAGLKYWQVADHLGITAGTFTVWLRTPLTADKKAEIEEAVKQLKAS